MTAKRRHPDSRTAGHHQPERETNKRRRVKKDIWTVGHHQASPARWGDKQRETSEDRHPETRKRQSGRHMKGNPGNIYSKKRNPKSRTPLARLGGTRGTEASKERHPESRTQ